MNSNVERWYSMEEICEHLGVSRDTVLVWIKNVKCLPQRWVVFGSLRLVKLMNGRNQEKLPIND